MSDAPDIEEIQSHASALMKQGIRLLNENASPAEALEYFDRELELHRRLPIEISPVLGFGLAACLLNRADALMRQGSATELKAAIAACDEAIGLLRRLPLTEAPIKTGAWRCWRKTLLQRPKPSMR
jgi:tetratricopeptide (TPR) repeat protein